MRPKVFFMEIYDSFNFDPNLNTINDVFDVAPELGAEPRLINGVFNYIWEKYNGADVVLDNNIPVLTAAEALDETIRLHNEDEELVKDTIASIAIFIAIRNRKKLIVTQVPPDSPFDSTAIYTRGTADGMRDKLSTEANVAEALANSFEVLENKAPYTGQRSILNKWKALAIGVSVGLDRKSHPKTEEDK